MGGYHVNIRNANKAARTNLDQILIFPMYKRIDLWMWLIKVMLVSESSREYFDKCLMPCTEAGTQV